MKVAAILASSVALCAPVVALALDASFDERLGRTWVQRKPLVGSRVVAPYADAAAYDGAVVRLVYPAKRPDWEGGPGLATQIRTAATSMYGRYTARLQSADCASNEGVVSAFFTYANDEVDWDGDGLVDNHEIDFEFLGAEPQHIYVAAWTDYEELAGGEAFHRIAARVNMRTGEVVATPSGGAGTWDLEPVAPLAFTVPAFDHTAQPYTYGFDWSETQVRFWIDLEDGAGERELFTINGAPGDEIPNRPASTFLNVWHNTVNWASQTTARAPQRVASFQVDQVTTP